MQQKIKVQKLKAFLRVFKYTNGNVLERVVPVQWTMRNLDDRNHLLVCILHICKDAMGHLPKVVGIDIVELALWAKMDLQEMCFSEGDAALEVENELVSQAEEEDLEALLGTMLKGIESAAICVEDMDEWLALFNVKLRHMREDIEAIETRNNKLELQSINYKGLGVELDKLLEKLHIPSEVHYFQPLVTYFDLMFDHDAQLYSLQVSDGLLEALEESSLRKYIEACEWLRVRCKVKEKRAELEIIKLTFVRKACDF
ncbi:putative exocyst complex component Sec3 [Helianthus annuus]|nr:putative exocyst complex component Sec3 [Helianthus annuus]